MLKAGHHPPGQQDSDLDRAPEPRLHEVGQPGKWSLAETAEIFRRIGIDRVLFGTNYPFVGQADYVAVMEQMPLSEDERRRIGADNYDHLYAAV